jgi:hypothetical protein
LADLARFGGVGSGHPATTFIGRRIANKPGWLACGITDRILLAESPAGRAYSPTR